MIDAAFWRGRRVFLTGHTGFKGAWLSAMLSHLGAETTGFSLDPPTRPALFDDAGLAAGLRDLRGDIRDATALAEAMRAASPEIVLHMAAQSLVKEGYAQPLATYAANVMGTAHVLDAARACANVRAIVVVTTDKCYENRERGAAFRESDALGGHDPYSSSKACAELVAASWRASFLAERGIGVASARAGNVIGGGDHARDRIVPDAMRAFAAGEDLLVRSPRAVRPWQHVLEPLTGYLMLAERCAAEPSRFSSAFNFGPGEDHERCVEDLLDRVIARWGGGARWIRDPRAHPHEAGLLRLDAAKARDALGWSCRLDFNETIAWTVDFYRAAAQSGQAGAILRAQVGAWFARIGQAACASS